MFIFLILGAIIGSFSVVFVLQNTTAVSVMFLSWQIEGSLAIILTATFVGGVLTTMLFFLPGLLSDWLKTTQMQKRIYSLEKEVAEAKEREVAALAKAAEANSPTVVIAND
jgi:uncharacterized integral membrane protein